MYIMKDNNKLNYTYDDNGIINNMVNDNDGNLNVIASVVNNVNKNFDNRVISVKDIPIKFLLFILRMLSAHVATKRYVVFIQQKLILLKR